jgi:ATP-dependent exoDNAse (exonuclease V) beta subunit
MSKIKIYKASAGSGKTYTLALEYIKELLIASSNNNYRHILAVTFTKDATGEMKDRILSELYGLAMDTNDSAGFLNSLQNALKEANCHLTEKQIREKSETALHNILHDYSRLNITTIDSFFQRVLRNLARELGRGSKFNLEMNTRRVLQEAVHATIEKAGQNKQILEWLTAYIEQKLDDERNWRIENEIFEFSNCIYNEFFQEHEPALRKQLKENPQIFKEIKIKQEQIQKECQACFVAAYRQTQQLLDMNDLAEEDFIRGIPIRFFRNLAERKYADAEINKTILNCSADSASWATKTHKRRNELLALADSSLLPLLNDCISNLKIVLTSQMITRNLHQLGLIWDITREITDQNAENNRFMLSDTAMFLNRMIDHSDAPFIYEKIGSEIRHVMIDEFQDTSRLQWSNFKSLLSNILANDDFSLIVGDVKQSIYRWRNGDWRILNSIENELKAPVRPLDCNYRSGKIIIDFNNSFFTKAAFLLNQLHSQQLKKLPASPFSSAYSEKEVHQKTKKKTEAGYVSIDFISNKKDEIPYSELMKETVFLQLKKLHKAGIPANNICILTRKNKEITVLAEYLASLKENQPAMAEGHYLDIISNEAFQLKSSLALRIIIEALRVVADPDNMIAREQLDYYLAGKSAAASLLQRKEIRCMPLSELCGHLYRFFQLEEIEGQSAYLFSFYDFLSKYLNANPTDIPHFLQYWEDDLKNQSIPAGAGLAGIRAMTIHKSKGLQFHTVIIPYCDWELNPKSGTTVWCGPKEGFYSLELLPVAYTGKMANTVFSFEYEEETAQSWMDNLNILYVGFTRAENNLILLAKYKKSLDGIDKIVTVSDLLQLSVSELDGSWDEKNLRFEKGCLANEADRHPSDISMVDNLLKQTPSPRMVSFVSKEFQPGQSIFRQSNQSREFLDDTFSYSSEQKQRKNGLLYGNIMHRLFEQINRREDIEKAVDALVIEGLIQPGDKQSSIDRVREAIRESQVEDWFEGRYESYKECSIITEEDGEIVNKRPDRVLLSEDTTLVIDYKFGEMHSSHKKQLKQYMSLLENMNYPNVKGLLWYVEKRKVEKVE